MSGKFCARTYVNAQKKGVLDGFARDYEETPDGDFHPLRTAEENNAGIVITFLKRTLDPANKRPGGKEATAQPSAAITPTLETFKTLNICESDFQKADLSIRAESLLDGGRNPMLEIDP